MRNAIKFDKILAITVLCLVLFGLVMITSIGVPKSISLSAPDVLYPNCSDDGVDCFLLLKKHIFRLFVGFVAFFVAYKIPMKIWKKLSPILFVAGVALLLLVLFSGDSYGTIASSWLVFFNSISLQPSELAKIGIIFYLAYWFSKRQKAVTSFSEGFIPFCLISGLVIIPTILQNDYGSMMVMALTCVSVYFVAGARVKHLAIGFAVALISIITIVTSVTHVNERFQSFLNTGEECVEDDCWQSRQANIAVGSGGFFGKGLTQGIQKSYWLPQASDDFIFAASAEELGFLRIVAVVIGYLIIAARGYKIANNAPNTFQKLLATGLTSSLVFQAFINISVNIGLFPVTGITLPFVSYGGSSLLASLVAIGIILNISKQSSHAFSTYRRGNQRSRNSQLRRYRRA